ncbi:MAG: flavodoxin [Bacillota bacterium]|nr:flavodoxin [Bacillota bacterium]
MKKVAIVYWSGTGNTEKMAFEIEAGAKKNGAEVNIFTSDEFSVEMLDGFDAIAFGCPAMGMEVLEESSFEPMFERIEKKLMGKNILLFGSYGWGDGQWMRDWEERCKEAGAQLLCESLIVNDAPDEDAVKQCKCLGEILA